MADVVGGRGQTAIPTVRRGIRGCVFGVCRPVLDYAWLHVEGEDVLGSMSPRCVVSSRSPLGRWKVLLTKGIVEVGSPGCIETEWCQWPVSGGSSERILPTEGNDSSPIGWYYSTTEGIERAPDWASLLDRWIEDDTQRWGWCSLPEP